MVRKFRALDLFCCQGGSSMGLHRAGFEVVGVDWEPQPRYPFEFVHGESMDYPFDGFDFVWASPPCQKYTLAQRIQNNEHPDLIAPLRKRLKASRKLWAIENVIGAPLEHPILLCGAMFSGLQVYRHRHVETSFSVAQPAHPEHIALLQKMGRRVKDGCFMHVVGNFSGVEQAKRAMGIDWMSRDGLREAIPPAYAEYIGRAAIHALRG